MDFSQIDDFEPQQRQRCDTWPLRPVIDPPLLHDSESNPAEFVIKEEPEDSDLARSNQDLSSNGNVSGKETLSVTYSVGSDLGSQGDLNNAAKKSNSRKNAWGNMSYADLITKAIMSSPEKKLTLSQIYDYMVQNVPYFRDKGDSTSSAGWKNSIRHNLSLHNRFMRIQNEGAGKSSWWVINPDAKPGKTPRRPRGGSMDNSKLNLKASKERAMKRVRDMKSKGILKDGETLSPVSPANDFTLSPGDYRNRASSFASDISGRRSPLQDDFITDPKLSPWGSESHLVDPYISDFSMETGNGKLADDLPMMKIDLNQSGSFIDELGEFANPYMDSPGIPSTTITYLQSAKPYSSYLEQGSSFNPPPPYPSQSLEQQQYNKINISSQQPTFYDKDHMTAGYNVNKGNNNTVSPTSSNQNTRLYSSYSNGMVCQQQNQRSLPAQPQRIIPNSIRAALGQNSSVPERSHYQSIPQSLKEAAPILTQQLLDYQPPNNSQSVSRYGNPGNPSSNMQVMNNQYSFTQELNSNSPNIYGHMTQQPFYPNDIDLNIDQMPELLSCDVDEIIQQELKMDGGHLDFSGFEGYSLQQPQQPTSNPNGGSSSSGNVGILS